VRKQVVNEFEATDLGYAVDLNYSDFDISKISDEQLLILRDRLNNLK
jgi:hypothetical protein